MMTSPDRDRGILTRDDRDYLTGRKNLTDGSERNARQRIRDRTRNALYDLEYLTAELDDRDVTQLVVDNGEPDKGIFNAAEDLIAFAFRLCQQRPDSTDHSTDELFRTLMYDGIEKSLADDHQILDFDLDLKYGDPGLAEAEILESLHKGKPLSLSQLREAVNNGYLDDSYIFRPLDGNGFPKNVDPKEELSHDDYRW
jgi:hypothetical protein